MTTTMNPQQRAEPAHDILHQVRRHPLDPIFSPKVVAVIGATANRGSVGRTVFQNMGRGGFEGTVYPVNPKRSSVLCVKAYPNVASIPEKVDLAVITTPAPTVPGLIRECAEAGVPGAVIISAGFKETGAAGAELERQVMEEARKGRMRLIGPNCLGVMVPQNGLNATFASTIAQPGSVGFISQSGALCTAILDWSLRENVGFSAFVSIGSMLDVNWGDLIYYLGDDPNTKSIVIYMESIGDARSFLSAAREVALTKPIIVIKVGRTEAAAKAAASHTGSLTGSDEVLQAAFRRVGVLRVETIAELFHMADLLAKQPRPQGPRLSIVTNAGGPGVLATDMLIGSGGRLAEPSPETMSALNQLLPPAWSHNNPIDILGDAGPDRYAQAVKLASDDPGSDGLLVILTPQAMTDPVATAEQLKPYAKLPGKPLLACWMGGKEVEPGEDILNAAGIPTYKYPDTAARAFYYMYRYTYNLRSLYETPAFMPDQQPDVSGRAKAEALIQHVRKQGRTILTEFESKQLLSAYGIPTVETRIAKTEETAVKIADELGYPIVLKLYSETITHKTDVGGVQLNLRNAAAVRKAYKAIESAVATRVGKEHFLGVTVQPMVSLDGYELIIGSSPDPQFGPVLLFGAGGQLVEVFKDRSLGLPPLNATLARRMMEQTRIFEALKGVRGRPPVNIAALEELLVRFSQLVVEQPWIAEIDINPLLASPERLIALDARVVVYGPKVTEDKLPQPAIRPYPTRYVIPWKLKSGAHITIRPIQPEDEPLLVRFHETLSEESVYYRYFSQLKLDQRIAHERLTRMCFNDYDREIALVAEFKDPKTKHNEILGVGRLSKARGLNEAEFALIISDRWQGQGLGTELLKRLVHIGRDEKLDRITANILAENHAMHHVSRKVGFKLHRDQDDHDFKAEILLK
ncbi:MAG TPA: bifunctional acetate--CoA ligase family protein/GNAT family N-acetyltransferase [Candidatus Binatia bacterium]|jgi:acetyltransferase|nr:bifunctional acetate--CoA ligase family protein/GNAT family N-acetyltransferase [Candidatus Binatia bacterium]